MKLVLFMFLISLVSSQSKIETKSITVFKKNDMNYIDFNEYIDLDDGIYKVELIELKNLSFEKNKKIMIENCEFYINLYHPDVADTSTKKVFFDKSTFGKEKISYKICKDIHYVKGGELKISRNKSSLEIDTSNFNNVLCEFVFWISGNFTESIDTGEYKDGGVLREWHDNEVLYIEYNFKGGKKHGQQLRWYENGQKEIIYNYKTCMLNGPQNGWYKNGQVKGIWNYKLDVLDGYSTEWYSNGQIKFKKVYDHGTLLELVESYDINGNVN